MGYRLSDDEIRQVSEMLANEVVPVGITKTSQVLTFLGEIAEALEASAPGGVTIEDLPRFDRARAVWKAIFRDFDGIDEELENLTLVGKIALAGRTIGTILKFLKALKKLARN